MNYNNEQHKHLNIEKSMTEGHYESKRVRRYKIGNVQEDYTEHSDTPKYGSSEYWRLRNHIKHLEQDKVFLKSQSWKQPWKRLEHAQEIVLKSKEIEEAKSEFKEYCSEMKFGDSN